MTAGDVAARHMAVPEIAAKSCPFPASATRRLEFPARRRHGRHARGHARPIHAGPFLGELVRAVQATVAGVRSIHERFAAQGLATLGLSLDEDSEAWQSALKELNLPWTQGRLTGRRRGDFQRAALLAPRPGRQDRRQGIRRRRSHQTFSPPSMTGGLVLN